MSTISEIATISAGILGGPAAAVYIEMDHLTTGHKINMERVVRDAEAIHAIIRRRCFSLEIDREDKIGGTS